MSIVHAEEWVAPSGDHFTMHVGLVVAELPAAHRVIGALADPHNYDVIKDRIVFRDPRLAQDYERTRHAFVEIVYPSGSGRPDPASHDWSLQYDSAVKLLADRRAD